jgi:hypothetical protein
MLVRVHRNVWAERALIGEDVRWADMTDAADVEAPQYKYLRVIITMPECQFPFPMTKFPGSVTRIQGSPLCVGMLGRTKLPMGRNCSFGAYEGTWGGHLTVVIQWCT